MTLTEFLLARIAEDEARAPSRHRMDPEGEPGYYYACPATRTEPWGDLPWGPDACDCGVDGRRRRVLAECEAKRRIVEIHHAERDAGWMSGEPNDWLWCTRCGSTDDRPVAFPCDTLRALALPYDEHPDFDPAWRIL